VPLITSAARSSCRDGYGNAKQQGKPVFPKMQKTRMNAGFLALTGLVTGDFVQIPFIAMLKLLFKFDRHSSIQQAGKRRLGLHQITDRSRARLGRQK
jgi:hypothetical protein